MDIYFVMVWVVVSFMFFEILVNLVGINLSVWFYDYVYLVLLVVVVIGLLFGCGL